MTRVKISGHYFEVPDNIHRAVKSVYELAVLTHLMQRGDEKGYSYPSQQTLAQGIMSTKQVRRATDALADRGIITVKHRWLRGGGIQLCYTVNMGVILSSVQQTDSPMDSQSDGVQRTDSLVQRTDSPISNGLTVQRTKPILTKPILTKPKKKQQQTFLEYVEGTKRDERFASVDQDALLEKFLAYDSDKPYKSKKAGWLTWLRKESAAKGNGHPQVGQDWAGFRGVSDAEESDRIIAEIGVLDGDSIGYYESQHHHQHPGQRLDVSFSEEGKPHCQWVPVGANR